MALGLRRSAGICLVVTGIGVSFGARLDGEVQADRIPGLLLYAAGDFDAGVAEAVRGRTPEAITTDFKNNAARWLDARRDAPGHQRLIVASFALEVARAFLEKARAKFQESGDATIDQEYDWARRSDALVEWACSLLREGRSDPAAGPWWRASVGFMMRDGEYGTLYGKETRFDIDGRGGHLLHARTALPGRSDFALVAALEPATQWVVSAVRLMVDRREELTPVDVQRLAAEYARVQRSREISHAADVARDVGPRVIELQRVVGRLLPLARDPAVGVEARFYLGAIALCFGGRDASRDYFSAVRVGTEDSSTRYLAAFLTGQADERDGRLADARGAYALALEDIPGAHSAATALTALRWLSGEPTVGAPLELPDAPDPWVRFVEPSEPISLRWATLLPELRGALR